MATRQKKKMFKRPMSVCIYVRHNIRINADKMNKSKLMVKRVVDSPSINDFYNFIIVLINGIKKMATATTSLTFFGSK